MNETTYFCSVCGKQVKVKKGNRSLCAVIRKWSLWPSARRSLMPRWRGTTRASIPVTTGRSPASPSSPAAQAAASSSSSGR